MKKAIRWAIFVVIIAAIVGAIVFALIPAPVDVEVASVHVAPMQVSVDEEGKTRIKERYVVSSPLAGQLGRITLDPGDPVVADETVLATIEPADPELLDARALAEAQARVRAAEAAVSQAEANAKRAQTTAGLAEETLTRTEEMAAQDAATDFELLKARADHRAAVEESRAADHAEEIAQYELELAKSALLYATGEEGSESTGRLRIHSPITGAVLRVFQESVAVVSPGTPLLELGDPRDLEIVVDVLSTDGVRVHPGDRVIIEQWGGDEPLEAIVRLVEPAAFTKVSALGIEEQRVNVIADFISPREDRATLGDAYRVEARIITWESDAVTQIPASAVFRDQDGWAVFVANSSRATKRRVEIGKRNDLAVQILSGLDQGASVVLHPSDRVHDGVRITPGRP
ncbi:MAG: HlyD family efflux transporter periplasmic adaptor subunit [Phycisphaerales bacterium]